MDKHAVAEKILEIVRDQDRPFGSGKDGISIFGQPQTLQKDAVQAIGEWIQNDNKEQIMGFVYLLQTMDIVSEEATNTLIDQINDAS